MTSSCMNFPSVLSCWTLATRRIRIADAKTRIARNNSDKARLVIALKNVKPITETAMAVEAVVDVVAAEVIKAAAAAAVDAAMVAETVRDKATGEAVGLDPLTSMMNNGMPCLTKNGWTSFDVANKPVDRVQTLRSSTKADLQLVLP